MNHETAERDDSPEGKGARPTTRIATHKLDPLHELNLLRMMQVANERTVRELGPLPLSGLPVQVKRKPELANSGSALPRSIHIEIETNHANEDDAMKLSHMAAIAALTVGAIACQSAKTMAGEVNTEGVQRAAVMPKRTPSAKIRPRLGPEYKKIKSFVEFRKKLLADGWEPVINPKCREDVAEGEYCDLAPEMTSYTSTFPGYLITRYIKDGTPLSVLSEGDITDLIEPGKYGLYVDNWDYESGN